MQILVVRINENFFGLDLSKIHEITTKVKITRVPNARTSVRGVTNLRGKIVPIVDLRARLGLKNSESPSNCFVFFRVDGNNLVVGTDVDEIIKTLKASHDDLRKSPLSDSCESEDGVLGLLPDPSLPKPIVLLDIYRVFDIDSNDQNLSKSQNV